MEEDKTVEKIEKTEESAKSEKDEYGSGYGKKSMGKWIAIYVIGAIIVYGLIYYVIKARNNTSGTSTSGSIYGQ